MFNTSLPIFILPWTQEFGWGRGQVSTAVVLAMLGMTVGAPLIGRGFDRFGYERVIATSVALFAALVYGMSLLPGSIIALGALGFVIGLAGSGTSMVAYAGVLPSWFDKKLGMALGLAGIGSGLGVGLSPLISTKLIDAGGWRSAFVGMSVLVLCGGMLACALIRPRRGERAPVTAKVQSENGATGAELEGLSLAQARRSGAFWLLFVVTFLVPFSVLGMALHGAALMGDKGFTPQQAAVSMGLAGLSAMAARIIVGWLLDRRHAPAVAAACMVMVSGGLALLATATSYPLLCVGILLGGMMMGAESDLLPFLIRRYFGMRSFGTLFGIQFSAYALGGVLGPIAYGFCFDSTGKYTAMAMIGAALCGLSAVAILFMGPYRFATTRR